MSKNECRKFCEKIAGFECGCAPSVGFMEKLILEARKATNSHDDDLEFETGSTEMFGIQKLHNSQTEWSDKQFSNGKFNQKRCIPISYHLQKEAKELTTALEAFINNPSKENCDIANKEFADCLLLLLDAANKYGLLLKTLIQLGFEKLEINKNREWGEPDENGVVEHVRGKDQKGGTK